MAASVRDAWRSDRLTFRSICADDQEWWFQNIDSNPENISLSTPVLLAPPRRSKPDDFMKLWNTPSSLMNLIICLGADEPSEGPRGNDEKEEAVAGGAATATAQETRIGFLHLGYGGYGTSPHSRACNFGIVLASAFWNKGYGTEATRWALDWAFAHGNMHSVNLGTVEYNTRAQRCYEKCGFRLTGRKRQCFWHNRRYWDHLSYDILEEEWLELQGHKGEGEGEA